MRHLSDATDESFYASLPATRGAAGALIRSGSGDVLLVRRTYKPDQPWGIPGGVIEAEESPLAACRREIGEELGVTAQVGGLLVVDWVPSRPPRTAALQWLFRVRVPGTGSQMEVPEASFQLPPDELSGWEWVPPEKLHEYLPEHIARRMLAAVSVDDSGDGGGGGGAPVYLEDGQPVLPR
ncbi:NUDIX domain-containing protein [Nocardiopsis oceani]